MCQKKKIAQIFKNYTFLKIPLPSKFKTLQKHLQGGKIDHPPPPRPNMVSV